jgi:hypothetical protein
MAFDTESLLERLGTSAYVTETREPLILPPGRKLFAYEDKS